MATTRQKSKTLSPSSVSSTIRKYRASKAQAIKNIDAWIIDVNNPRTLDDDRNDDIKKAEKVEQNKIRMNKIRNEKIDYLNENIKLKESIQQKNAEIANLKDQIRKFEVILFKDVQNMKSTSVQYGQDIYKDLPLLDPEEESTTNISVNNSVKSVMEIKRKEMRTKKFNTVRGLEPKKSSCNRKRPPPYTLENDNKRRKVLIPTEYVKDEIVYIGNVAIGRTFHNDATTATSLPSNELQLTDNQEDTFTFVDINEIDGALLSTEFENTNFEKTTRKKICRFVFKRI